MALVAHTLILTPSLSVTHTHTHTHSLSLSLSLSHTHKHEHKHTHTHTHTQTNTHTHKHTNTHTDSLSLSAPDGRAAPAWRGTPRPRRRARKFLPARINGKHYSLKVAGPVRHGTAPDIQPPLVRKARLLCHASMPFALKRAVAAPAWRGTPRPRRRAGKLIPTSVIFVY